MYLSKHQTGAISHNFIHHNSIFIEILICFDPAELSWDEQIFMVIYYQHNITIKHISHQIQNMNDESLVR